MHYIYYAIKQSLMYKLCFIVFFFQQGSLHAAEPDSLGLQVNKRSGINEYILPSALCVYGLAGLRYDQIRLFGSGINIVENKNTGQPVLIDDILQFTPAMTVYGLNAFNISGRNDFRERTIVLVSAYFIMSGTVFGLKSITNIERPDGSDYKSFPSGHTANVFVGAEFLRQEYKDVSVWYGIAGYTVAAGTGVSRVYHGRHWLTDVAAGAGVGILSTKLAYWIYPYIDKLFFDNRRSRGGAVFKPFYNGSQAGFGLILEI